MSMGSTTLRRRRARARELLGATDNRHPYITLTFRALWWIGVHATALPLIDLALVAALWPAPGRYLAAGTLVAIVVSFAATGRLDALVDWHAARFLAARIRATWAATCAANGLAANGDIPGLRRSKAKGGTVILDVRLANGQTLETWLTQLDGLAAKWRSYGVEAVEGKRPGNITLLVSVRDVLARAARYPGDR